MTILSILDRLASDPSKNAKEAILREHSGNEVLKRVFFLAYQPTVNFYTKQIPVYGDTKQPLMSLEDALEAARAFLAERIHTGKAAQDYLKFLLESVTSDDAEVLRRVVLRDLRTDCAGNTANKVWKDLILDVPYMRCCLPKDAKLKTWPWKDGVLSQLKSDGSFTNISHFESGACGAMTRNGNTYPEEAFEDVFAAIQKTHSKGMQFHGELLVITPFGEVMERAEGNGMLNSVQKGESLPPGYSIRYVVWDMIPISEAKPKNKYKYPYNTRLAMLESLGLEGAVEVVETRVVHSIREAYEHYQEQVEKGLEGTILKHPGAIWEDTTSKNQVKFKLDVDVELRIVGKNPGKGKNADTFGSLQCVSGDELVRVNVAIPKPEDRKRLHAMGDDLFGQILTARSNAMTKVRKDGTRSLFLPRGIELRTDKTEADSLQRIMDQFEAAVRNLEQLVEA